MKVMGPNVGYFAGFCDHHLMTMSVHMYGYHYPVFESGLKIGLRMISLFRKYKVLLGKHKKQQ